VFFEEDGLPILHLSYTYTTFPTAQQRLRPASGDDARHHCYAQQSIMVPDQRHISSRDLRAIRNFAVVPINPGRVVIVSAIASVIAAPLCHEQRPASSLIHQIASEADYFKIEIMQWI
jgi:hypothetical protein